MLNKMSLMLVCLMAAPMANADYKCLSIPAGTELVIQHVSATEAKVSLSHDGKTVEFGGTFEDDGSPLMSRAIYHLKDSDGEAAELGVVTMPLLSPGGCGRGGCIGDEPGSTPKNVVSAELAYKNAEQDFSCHALP